MCVWDEVYESASVEASGAARGTTGVHHRYAPCVGARLVDICNCEVCKHLVSELRRKPQHMSPPRSYYRWLTMSPGKELFDEMGYDSAARALERMRHQWISRVLRGAPERPGRADESRGSGACRARDRTSEWQLRRLRRPIYACGVRADRLQLLQRRERE